MADVTSGLRSPIGRARGLGSAKHGTEHWWGMRLSSLALIPLSLYLLYGVFAAVVFGNGYTTAYVWMQSPINAAAVILYLAIGLHHTAHGLQVVIEDYVHSEAKKIFLLLAVNASCGLLALAGILASLKIMLGA